LDVTLVNTFTQIWQKVIWRCFLQQRVMWTASLAVFSFN